MVEKGLKELYIDELKDLYSAENQLMKALPKMAKAATAEELNAGFEEHLEQTKGHVQRFGAHFSRNWAKAPRARSARAWKVSSKKVLKRSTNMMVNCLTRLLSALHSGRTLRNGRLRDCNRLR
jgi:ferritin-like metal-binding protein YciE